MSALFLEITKHREPPPIGEAPVCFRCGGGNLDFGPVLGHKPHYGPKRSTTKHYGIHYKTGINDMFLCDEIRHFMNRYALLIRRSLVRVQQGEPRKTTVSVMKTVVFLIFYVILIRPTFSIWANFGPMGPKIYILGHRPDRRAAFLCLLPEQHIRNTLRCLGFVFLNDVTVKVFCGVHAGVAQLLRYRDNIGTVGQKNRGHRVAEGVGVDMRQIVPAGKVMEPAGDAVRVHVAAIVRREYKSGVLPTVAVGDLEPELFPFVEP